MSTSVKYVTVTIPALEVVVTISGSTAKVNGVERTIAAWRAEAEQSSPHELNHALAKAVVRAVDGQLEHNEAIATVNAAIERATSTLRLVGVTA